MTTTLLPVPTARWLQTALNRVLGAGLVVDGIVGPRTRAAIARFQRQVGHRPTGVPDAALTEALRAVVGRAGGGPAPQPSRPAAALGCARPLAKATTFPAYIDLLRRAERELARVGRTSLEDRIHALSGLYYGTPWSLDFATERSTVRNTAFQVYIARRYGPDDDPRRWNVDCGPLAALWRSQDVAGVDVGHAMIGLGARMRFASRSVPLPPAFATGLEITTWIGDLGGAAARLAVARLTDPRASVRRWFTGTDYGSSSNLEGDIGAYILASGGASSIVVPRVPSGSVADAFADYFVARHGWRERFARFLTMNGGRMAGTGLANRSEVHAAMAAKVRRFGTMYLVNFERSRAGGPARIAAAAPGVTRAADEITNEFLDRLLSGARSGRLP